MSAAAALLRRGLLRLRAGGGPPRPAPALLLLPGLTARAWWSVSDVPGLAAALPALASSSAGELAALEAASPAGDYERRADEHARHGGGWAWQSLLMRGAGRPDAAARERCKQSTATVFGLAQFV